MCAPLVLVVITCQLSLRLIIYASSYMCKHTHIRQLKRTKRYYKGFNPWNRGDGTPCTEMQGVAIAAGWCVWMTGDLVCGDVISHAINGPSG